MKHTQNLLQMIAKTIGGGRLTSSYSIVKHFSSSRAASLYQLYQRVAFVLLAILPGFCRRRADGEPTAKAAVNDPLTISGNHQSASVHRFTGSPVYRFSVSLPTVDRRSNYTLSHSCAPQTVNLCLPLRRGTKGVFHRNLNRVATLLFVLLLGIGNMWGETVTKIEFKNSGNLTQGYTYAATVSDDANLLMNSEAYYGSSNGTGQNSGNTYIYRLAVAFELKSAATIQIDLPLASNNKNYTFVTYSGTEAYNTLFKNTANANPAITINACAVSYKNETSGIKKTIYDTYGSKTYKNLLLYDGPVLTVLGTVSGTATKNQPISETLKYSSTATVFPAGYYALYLDYGSSTGRIGSLTLKAVEIGYTVTYNANGATSGDVPTDGTKYEKNADVTVLGNTAQNPLVKTGYNFDGWNTKADGTGTDYSAGSTFSISANTTLYAKWTEVQCTSTTLSIAAGSNTLSRTGSSVTTTITPTLGDNTSSVVYGVYSDNACTSTASGASISGTTFTATEGGTYYVRATQVFDGTYCATTSNVVEITVTVPVSSISLNKTSTSIAEGKSETLTATVNPSDATNKNVTWSSNAESVATVDANGKVTGVGVGTATITVKSVADESKTATCTVTVIEGVFTDNIVWKTGSGYTGCVENPGSATTSTNFSTSTITGASGMDRPTNAGDTWQITINAKEGYVIQSICIYGKAESTGGDTYYYGWDSDVSSTTTGYGEGKVTYEAPANGAQKFTFKYTANYAASEKKGGVYWRNALVTLKKAPKTFTVTFDTQGGSTVGSLTEPSVGAGIILPAAPTKNGYTFKGWYAAATGGEPVGAVGSNYKPSSNCTLYAQWTAIVYDITYYAEKDFACEKTLDYLEPKKYTIETTTPFPTTATKTGYTFEKWWKYSNSEWKEAPETPKGYYGNFKLYASWIINTYTVSASVAQASDGWGTVSPAQVENVAHESSIAADGNLLKINGETAITATPTAQSPQYDYAFKEWTGIPAGGQVLEATTVTASFTQTARTYNITYNKNDGEWVGDEPSTTYTYGVGATLPTSEDITRDDGATFLGWFDNESLEGTAITKIDEDATGDKEFYASWTDKATYTITYDMNGHGTAIDPTTVIEGNQWTAPEDPTETGYTFDGWKRAAETGDETLYKHGDTGFTPESDETLTAQWTAVSYTITYTNTYDVEHSNPATYTIEDETITFAEPTTARTGYTFAGWSPATIDAGSTGDVAVSATWNIVSYTITYTNTYDVEHSNPATYTIESETITFAEPTTARTGYTFDGWDPATIDAGSTGDKTTTAQWNAKTYTVTLEDGDGTGGQGTVAMTYNSKIPNLTSVPSLDHNEFGGYFTGQNGTGTQYYDAEGTAKDITWTTDDAAFKLYAKWTYIKEESNITWNNVPTKVYKGGKYTFSVETDNDAAKLADLTVSGTGASLEKTISTQDGVTTFNATLSLTNVASAPTITLDLSDGVTRLAKKEIKTPSIVDCEDVPEQTDNTTHTKTFTKDSNTPEGWSKTTTGGTTFADETGARKIGTITYTFDEPVYLKSVYPEYGFGSKDACTWTVSIVDKDGKQLDSKNLSSTPSSSKVKMYELIEFNKKGVKQLTISNTSSKDMLVGKIEITIITKEAIEGFTVSPALAWPDGTANEGTKNYVFDGNDINMAVKSNSAGTIAYTSSDETVATITNGVVKTRKKGETTLTASIVAYGCYEAQEITCTLNVTYPDCQTPTINEQPQSKTYCEGEVLQDLTIDASVADGETIHYQWYKDGEEIEDETDDTYTPTEAGTYYCKLTATREHHEDATKQSDDAVITINPLPGTQITGAGQIQKNKDLVLTAPEGSSYQWYSCDDAQGTNPVELAKTQTYTVNKAEMGDYYYYCYVTNEYDCGIRSEIVTVSVVDRRDEQLTWTGIDNVDFYQGGRYTVTVTGEHACPTLTFSDNINVESNTVAEYTRTIVFLVNNDAPGTISLTASIEEDDEYFRKEETKTPAIADCGSAPDPVLTWSDGLAIGTTIQKTCEDDPFTYTASSNSPSTGAITYSSNNTDLAIVNEDGTVTLQDGITGTATITATQAASGCFRTAFITYIVERKATTISVHPQGTTYYVNQTNVADLSVTADGAGTLSYQWYKDNQLITDAEASTYKPSVTDAGTSSYTCVVTGSCGSVTSNPAVIKVIPVAEISISDAEAETYAGRKQTLTITTNSDAKPTVALGEEVDGVTLGNVIGTSSPYTVDISFDADFSGEVTLTATVATTDSYWTNYAEQTFSVSKCEPTDHDIFSMSNFGWTDKKSLAKDETITFGHGANDYSADVVGGTASMTNTYDGTKEALRSGTIYFNSNAEYVLITLADDGKLQDGDVVSSVENDVAVSISTTGTKYSTSSYAYTITEEDGLAGSNVLYVWRPGGSSINISGLSISRNSIPDPIKPVLSWDNSMTSGTTVDVDVLLGATSVTHVAIPDKATLNAVEYVSSNTEIAPVDANGVVALVNPAQIAHGTEITITASQAAVGCYDDAKPITYTIRILNANTFANADGAGNGKWSEPTNWSEGVLPTIYCDATIEQNVIVDINTAIAKSVILDGGTIEIASTAALQVEGTITRADGKATHSSDIYIHSDALGSGSLIFDNSNGNSAYVESYSLARQAEDGSRYWQYIGVQTANADFNTDFYGAYTYRHDESNAAYWTRVKTGKATMFKAYGVTKKAICTYLYEGNLAPTTTQEIALTYTESGTQGINMVANSWTAPIDITKMTTADFGDAEAVIYIYNTGNDSLNTDYEKGKTFIGSSAGQWLSIPVNATKANGYEGLKVIPSGQAFEIHTSQNTTLTLDYNRIVRHIGSPIGTEPMRAPSRATEDKIDPSEIYLMRIRVSGEQLASDIYLAEDRRFSVGYDNGWDGYFSSGDERAMMFYSLANQTQMAVNAVPDIEGTLVGFEPNAEQFFTISFNYNGEKTYYLNDLQENKSTLIGNDQTYMFMAGSNDLTHRFQISTTPIDYQISTGNDRVKKTQSAIKFIENTKLYILLDGQLYDGTGKMLNKINK